MTFFSIQSMFCVLKTISCAVKLTYRLNLAEGFNFYIKKNSSKYSEKKNEGWELNSATFLINRRRGMYVSNSDKRSLFEVKSNTHQFGADIS